MKHMRYTLWLELFVFLSLFSLVVISFAAVSDVRELSHSESQKVIGSKGIDDWGLIIADEICQSSLCPTTSSVCETANGCGWGASANTHQGGSECRSVSLGSLHLCQETLAHNTCGFFFFCEWDEDDEACLATVVNIIWTPKDCSSI